MAYDRPAVGDGAAREAGQDVIDRKGRTSGMRWALLIAVTVALSGPSRNAWAADPSGLWITENGNARVKVAPCGGGYCGTIVSTPVRALDAQNPDVSLRGRSIVGVQILEARTADGAAYSGTLYNPNDGKTYSGSVRLVSQTNLEVSGCVLGVFCRKQVWKRAE